MSGVQVVLNQWSLGSFGVRKAPWWGGENELMSNGYRVSDEEDGDVLEIDVGDLHNSVNVLNATKLYT